MERIFFEELGTRDEYNELAEGHPYKSNVAAFIRVINGIDRKKALDIYQNFIEGHNLTSDKSSLIEALKEDSHVVIVLDYTLFDINDAAELCIISQRFPEALWILFSEDLSQDFLREIVLTCPKCGILLKDCSMAEIREALDFASKGKRYICQQITELLLATPSKEENLHEMTTAIIVFHCQ